MDVVDGSWVLDSQWKILSYSGVLSSTRESVSIDRWCRYELQTQGRSVNIVKNINYEKCSYDLREIKLSTNALP